MVRELSLVAATPGNGHRDLGFLAHHHWSMACHKANNLAPSLAKEPPEGPTRRDHNGNKNGRVITTLSYSKKCHLQNNTFVLM